jgi:DNA-binding LytR/AlgR family response regulator
MRKITAIIADDEELSRAHLKTRLLKVWPDLIICGEAENGLEAIDLIETHHPDVAFLDIRMPGISGIAVARKFSPHCKIVFITAYDRYAVNAFENEAIDYILKPVLPERLEKTINRIKESIIRDDYLSNLPDVIERLSSVLDCKKNGSAYLKWIRVQINNSVKLIPVEKIYFFQASNKYTQVITKNREALIRKPISILSKELDPDMFFKIHRKTIVNAFFIEKVDTSATGRGLIKLFDRSEIHTVSRSYTHLFRQM